MIPSSRTVCDSSVKKISFISSAAPSSMCYPSILSCSEIFCWSLRTLADSDPLWYLQHIWPVVSTTPWGSRIRHFGFTYLARLSKCFILQEYERFLPLDPSFAPRIYSLSLIALVLIFGSVVQICEIDNQQHCTSWSYDDFTSQALHALKFFSPCYIGSPDVNIPDKNPARRKSVQFYLSHSSWVISTS